MKCPLTKGAAIVPDAEESGYDELGHYISTNRRKLKNFIKYKLREYREIYAEVRSKKDTQKPDNPR